MFTKPAFAVVVVSLILLIYCVLINADSTLPIAYFIFAISPFLLLWMVYTIIRYGIYKGQELKEGEEWGYEDRSKEELGVL
jgi:hypothetical protein